MEAASWIQCFQVKEAADALNNAFLNNNVEDVYEAHGKVIDVTSKVTERMVAFEVKKQGIPCFKFDWQYRRMVLQMMLFLRAVRTGDWT